MNIKDLELSIVSYCEQKVSPVLPSTLDKWLLYAGLAVCGTKMEKIIQSIAPAAAQAGIIDADGNIDIDLLEKIGTVAFHKQPKVQLWKLTFGQDDFADFIRHLRGTKAPEVKA